MRGTPGERAAVLRQLSKLHAAYSVEHGGSTPVPDGFGEDVAVHHLDAASPPDAEAAFQQAAQAIMPSVLDTT